MTICSLLTLFGLSTWLPQIMRTAGYGLSSSVAFLLVYSAGGIVGTLVAAHLAQRLGAKAMVLTGFAAATIALAVLAIKFATGSGRSSSQQQQQTTAGVFGWPGGRWWVALAGLALIGSGVYHVYKGVSKKFMKQIDTSEASPQATRVIERLGQVGFPAKGVALGLVGGLFGYAAITFDPSKARGLDGAMHTILSAPFGQWLLTLVALGIVAFGAFLFARARYPERT